MVSYDTKYSLVIVGCGLRIELDDDTGLGVRRNSSLSSRE